MDRRADLLRADPAELRAAQAAARVAPAVALPAQAGGGAGSRAQSAAAAAGERQHQTQQRRLGCLWRLRPGDGAGVDEGEASPAEMAELAQGRLRRKRADLARTLEGHVEEHPRFLLALQLQRVEATERDIEQLDERIAERLIPYQLAVTLLMQIPGVDWVVAAAVIAEIGTDMSVFVSVHHLAAWAGLCPGSYESAGKHKSVAARKGNVHLRTILLGAAMAAKNTKGSYYKDKYHRLKARRGAKRAARAIAHKILVAI